MSNNIIRINVTEGATEVHGELLDVSRAASLQVFSSDAIADKAGWTLRIDPVHGAVRPGMWIEQPEHAVSVGEIRCVSASCVSDVSFMADHAGSAFHADLLIGGYEAHLAPIGMEQHIMTSLHGDLNQTLPRIEEALSGKLGLAELTQLIADLQGQVLELTSVSTDVFGNVSSEVNQIVTALQDVDSLSLLTSLSVDSAALADLDAFGMHGTLASATTLDGLFTSPESFPLTLDFSTPHHVSEATEVFASAASSISSGASIQSDGFGTSDFPGNTDLS